ncbi:hypothetical protein D7B24_009336 [Verticillium nonalfalfae]|uniref:SnoaL-like domain-containing protein n=2 Tax=Verticillium TaxID=1036719 RepID=C9SWU6_VERA1|nr:conserved hypothetical protein [Verticillium alfalfae VaMs.102]XP_028493029.1 uncharacterized protein D7B24_009336 [Verticillium nonalfalfae]EEY23487.1 conserved hypothetical protein [Verticillium alfalfae VaMs.102]RNJ54871.1 hypothetical protein D7B24_009336 [Verticillium nonalfalfae]
MRVSALIAFSASCLGITASASPSFKLFSPKPNCPPQSANPWQQRAILADFVEAFFVEQNATKAILNHIAEDYIQHNPGALSGRQNALDALVPFLSLPGVNLTVLRQGFENNLAFIHSRLDIDGVAQPTAIVDIFRFNGTCIVEHWDVVQARDPNSINPLALF